MRQSHTVKNLIRDLTYVAINILVAFVILKTGVLESILSQTQGFGILGSFIAGFFFTSAFTLAPATIVLVKIAEINPVFQVAVFGGLGAMVGDYILFMFFKDKLSQDVSDLIKQVHYKRLARIFRLRLFRWVVPLVGALIIASPFPDEIGLAMMGLSRMKTKVFLPVSFVMNTIGILAVCAVANII